MTTDLLEQPTPAMAYRAQLTPLELALVKDVQKQEASLERFMRLEAERLRALLAPVLDAHGLPMGVYWRLAPEQDGMALEWSEPPADEVPGPTLGRTERRQAIKAARRRVRMAP